MSAAEASGENRSHTSHCRQGRARQKLSACKEMSTDDVKSDKGSVPEGTTNLIALL